MSIGSAIGSSLGRAIGSALAGGASWSPLALFAAGEKGVWYDPSDFSSMFQDSEGTTPVTAVGQTVGLMLDKSAGLARGSELQGSGVIGLAGTATAATYNTGTGAFSVTRVDSNNQSYVQWSGLNNAVMYRVDVINSGANNLSVRRGTFSGSTINVAAGASHSVYLFPAGGLITVTTGGGTVTGTITGIAQLPGNHATQATAGSRPLLQQDGAGKYYLDFDGTDDSLATAAIDFTATDAMTVCAGVRKDSDAAQGCIAELTASVAANNGAWLLAAPDAASATFAFDSKGTAQVDAVASGNAAPKLAVLTATADISADSCVLRVNAAAGDSDAGDQGTGNYANAAMYIGARGGTSLYFNGRIYQLVVRGSATASLTDLETYVNSKTGAY